MPAPIAFQWDGEAMQPLRRFAKECDERFVIGQVYSLEEVAERSSASHRHFFAAVNDAWANLPEGMARQFPTAEHLRKYALIQAGFCDHRTLAASSKAEALRLAGFVRPMDEYAIVTTDGPLVSVHTAQSQSMKAMGKETFQRSKDEVLRVLDEMLNLPAGELARQAGMAA